MGKKNLFSSFLFFFKKNKKKHLDDLERTSFKSFPCFSLPLYSRSFLKFLCKKSLPHTYLPTLHLNLAHSMDVLFIRSIGPFVIVVVCSQLWKNLNKKHRFQFTWSCLMHQMTWKGNLIFFLFIFPFFNYWKYSKQMTVISWQSILVNEADLCR
jgi:hypothetical protein